MSQAEITAGAHADHRDCDYRFTRQRADRAYIPLERSAPIFFNRSDVIATIVLIALFVAAFVVPGIIVAVSGY